MDRAKSNSKPQNQHLIIILTILIIAIVSLTVGIIVTSTSAPSQDNTSEQQEEEEDPSTQLRSNEISDEDLAIDQHLTEVYNATYEQAQTLINTEPINIAAINELYNSGIAECLTNNASNYAANFMRSRTELYIEHNLKQAALDALVNMDWDTLSKRLGDPELYRQYTQIIELAEELGDTATANQYKELRTTVEDGYQSEYDSTKNALEAAGEQGED